jgi:transcriptional regulator with XRE-family HTH domain
MALSRVTGRLILAARALTGVSRRELAAAAGLSVEQVRRREASDAAWIESGNEIEAIVKKLEDFGAVFIDERDGMGAGVRLKFMRDDVKQIGRLETEGGVGRDDDLP